MNRIEMNNFMIPMTFEAITSFSMVDSTRKSNAFLVKTDSEGGSKSKSEKWIENKAIDFKNTKWLSRT